MKMTAFVPQVVSKGFLLGSRSFSRLENNCSGSKLCRLISAWKENNKTNSSCTAYNLNTLPQTCHLSKQYYSTKTLLVGGKLSLHFHSPILSRRHLLPPQVKDFTSSCDLQISSKQSKYSSAVGGETFNPAPKLKSIKKRRALADSEKEISTNDSNHITRKAKSPTTACADLPSGAPSTTLIGHDFLTFDPGLALPHLPPIGGHPKPDYEVAAYATADEYNLEELLKGFQKLGLYERSLHHTTRISSSPELRNRGGFGDSIDFEASEQAEVKGYRPSSHPGTDELDCIPDIAEVLHVVGQYKISSEPREIFFFRDGSVVFWNVDELERSNVLTYIKQFSLGDLVSPETMEEQSESLPYTYSENKTRLSGGRILLSEAAPHHLERYTFSNALAHSVKLGVWETELDHYIDSIKPVAEELRKSGMIILPKKEVFTRLGQLYELRHSLTLSSDLLDPSDYYWDRDALELLYKRTSNYLSIARRTEVMSDKLNNCVQLLELLKNYHGEEQSHRLERIIIYLIIIEVVFEMLHFIIK